MMYLIYLMYVVAQGKRARHKSAESAFCVSAIGKGPYKPRAQAFLYVCIAGQEDRESYALVVAS